MQEVIREIRRKLYLRRDGASSASMREKGVGYKLNFGVPIPTLREIARSYPLDRELAAVLWKEDTRELKLLATLIQDPANFEEVEEWVEGTGNVELAEQLAMNLLSRLPDAGKRAARWINSEREYTRTIGFLVYIRLFMENYELEGEEHTNFFHGVFDGVNSPFLPLRNASLNAMKHLGRQSATTRKSILAECNSTDRLNDETKRELYDDLTFNFDFYA